MEAAGRGVSLFILFFSTPRIVGGGGANKTGCFFFIPFSLALSAYVCLDW